MAIRCSSFVIRRSQRAFTLIELVLVMTLLIIVVSIAAPTLGNFFRGRALDSEVRRLLALTRHGQGRAVSEGVPMLLWVDAKERTYGLEEEAGYSDLDTNAITLRLASNLQVEVLDPAPVPTASVPARTPVRTPARAAASLASARGLHAHLPAIRFLPDGSFSELSPRGLRLLDQEGATTWLLQSRNRLNYEIRSQPDLEEEILR